MSRSLTLFAAAFLAIATPLAADTVSITVEGNATITIQTAPEADHAPNGARMFHHTAPDWTMPKILHDMDKDALRQGLEQLKKAPSSQRHRFDSEGRVLTQKGDAHQPAPRGPKNTLQRPPQANGPTPMGQVEPAKPIVDTPIEQSELPAAPRCDAAKLAGMVGQKLPATTSLMAMDLADSVRILTPGQAYTLDRRTNRATIFVDAAGTVTDASCS